MPRPALTRIHWLMIVFVALGATLIALIGLGGSYLAVREVALRIGMGRFASVFPIGVDAGIVVLLQLDLLLTWLRIPFPLLRPTAWALTAATIAFNASTSWPDPLGTGMHAVIPVLFIIVSEAARHAISRLARLSSDTTVEKIRLIRWILAPRQTAAMWRRMHLWEIRSLDEAILLEQSRLAYRTLLDDAEHANGTALPAAAHLPLKLAKLGVPIEVTYQDGLAAAGVPSRPLDQIFAARAAVPGRHLPQAEHAPAPQAAVTAPRKETAGPVGAVPPAAPGTSEYGPVGNGRSAVPGKAVHQVQDAPQEQYAPQSSSAYSQVSTLAGGFAGPWSAPGEAVRDAQEAAEPGQESALSARIPEVWRTGFRTWVDEHGSHPDQEQLAQYLYDVFALRARGKDEPVSRRSVERYYNDLKTLVPVDREQLRLEGVGTGRA